MKYQTLGQSGLRVSELALGTMTFGDDWGWGADKETCKQLFETYAEAGGNFVDTANYYTNGSSERIVGDLIKSERDHFVLSSKFSLNMNPTDINAGGNHRKNIWQSLKASLKRLDTDYLDIFWLHIWDFTTPVEEIIQTLDDIVRQGLVHYIGISDTPAWVVAEANALAKLRGSSPFVASQAEYSLVKRDAERDLIPMADHFGMSTLAWSPLGGGLLTGKYQKGQARNSTRLQEGNSRFSEQNLSIAQKVVDIAKELGCEPSQVALAWLLAKNNIIPIIGSRKVAQLEQNLACLEIELTNVHLTTLNEVSQIDLGFPHNFINSENNRKMIFGENYPNFRNQS